MTNEGQLHQISAEIGGLTKAVDIMMKQWERQEESASAGRRALHEKFEAFKTDVGLQIAGLSLRVDRLTDQIKREEILVEGEKRLGKKIWVALMAVAGVTGWGINELITWLHPK